MTGCVAIRHVHCEDLGTLGAVLRERGLGARYVEAWSPELAALDPLAPDLLVVLGGPIGAYEEAIHPNVATELALIARRLEAGRPVLGICLGAQLMARALGARVYPGPAKELGWGPLILSDAGRRSPLRHVAPDRAQVLHWHGDTFDLPPGATLLASTAAVTNQAFSRGPNALALQFHAEAGPDIEPWLIAHACEIAATPGVSVPGLRADAAAQGPALARQGRALFADWLDGLQR